MIKQRSAVIIIIVQVYSWSHKNFRDDAIDWKLNGCGKNPTTTSLQPLMDLDQTRSTGCPVFKVEMSHDKVS